MRVPLSWLREFVDVPAEATPEDVHAALVRVGLEEEDIHRFEVSGPVVVGEVLDFVNEPQSNGKTIRWCQVRVGPEEVRGIVCGAHNFQVGDKVVVALPGSVLPGPFPIAARKTYGHVSDGMIASVRELGLGEEHDGILRLAELGLDPVVGADAVKLLGLDDSAVEVNITPDRGYAFSIRGIAREYAHATGAVFRDPAIEGVAGRADEVAGRVAVEDGVSRPLPRPSGFPVAVEDVAPLRGRPGASVFITRVVRGVDPSRPTPAWMVARLKLAGFRSISLVVDITNYVMLELGQPIHAYDFDRLHGGITVRRAAPAETLTTLDGQTRTLHPEDLLITDESGPIGLAGVMGGETTEIGSTTSAVLVEAANFDPVSVARTARRHKLPSEASKRFERGVDPLVAEVAAGRVVHLLEQLAGGTADSLGSHLDSTEPAQPIRLPDGYIAGLLGVEYTQEEILASLTEIGSRVERTATGLRVTPPSWRPDLTDKADLAEEVARIVGYQRIPSVLPVAPPGRGLTRAQQLRRSVMQVLAANGLTEVLAYPFVTARDNSLFGSPTGGTADRPVGQVRLANPLDAQMPYLRTSLLPGLIEIAKRNLSRGLTDLALFEAGSVFRPDPGQVEPSELLPAGNRRPSDEVLAGLNASIPSQPLHLAVLLLGSAIEKQPGQPGVGFGVADAVQTIRQLGFALGVPLEVRQGRHQAFHPGRTIEVLASGQQVGFAGELLPALAEEFDLPRRVAVLEVDLGALIDHASPEITPVPIGTLPAATQDLSLVVAASVPAAELLAVVAEGAGELLEDARLVDDYRGPGVADGCKSLTFALRFRAFDRTLTAGEANDAKLAGVAAAMDRFGATLRE